MFDTIPSLSAQSLEFTPSAFSSVTEHERFWLHASRHSAVFSCWPIELSRSSSFRSRLYNHRTSLSSTPAWQRIHRNTNGALIITAFWTMDRSVRCTSLMIIERFFLINKSSLNIRKHKIEWRCKPRFCRCSPSLIRPAESEEAIDSSIRNQSKLRERRLLSLFDHHCWKECWFFPTSLFLSRMSAWVTVWIIHRRVKRFDTFCSR